MSLNENGDQEIFNFAPKGQLMRSLDQEADLKAKLIKMNNALASHIEKKLQAEKLAKKK